MADIYYRYRSVALAGFLAFGGVLAISGPALADSIDGQWCSPDGRTLTIAGPKLVTPGGAQMTGNYSRHAFTYVVPGNEPGAGSTIFMSLLNETTVNVHEGAPIAAPVVWKRCEHTV